jgi:hypothetical protein
MASDDADKESGPFRRPAFILSAGFLAAIAVLAAFMVRASLSDDPAPAKSSPPPTSAGNAGAVPAGTGGCRPTDTNQSIPTAAPPGVTWQVFKSSVLPTSPAAGPLITEGEVVRCYAHTPTGALIAATQISARVEIADGWRQVLDRSVVAGAGREVFVQEHSKEASRAPTEPGSLAQVNGFRFVTYSPETAVIELVVRAPNTGSLASSVATVKWVGGDWKLELQPDGSANSQPRLIDSLDGYARWGGV